MPKSHSTTSLIRSEIMSATFLVARHNMRRALDPLTDAQIGSRATDVPRHRGVDIAIRRVGLGGEQRRCGHDLAGMAIAALRHVQLDPSLLNLSAGGCGANGLNRGDPLAGRSGDRRDA